ncbi:hypothetical protein B0J13DRAFT_4062 [Dactylonectria estremocensis]|uniref:Uncharacterized protein n=1 Tax=Dactylonectria estremocensis TaxID=1079267 RepID=A0A9P9FH98_9HYPO|nr:hypothetical protein B0J13DRAFT_4062 [Dactylonectria estremocensis]
MVGLLIPDHYVAVKPDPNDMNIASIAWGVSMGVCIFTAAKGARQTINSWKRGRKMNPYVILLWMEWASSTIMSALVWCYLRGYIEPGFIFFFMVVLLWSIQIQALIQVIINRIAILMVNRQSAKKLKIIAFLIMLAINISVFCVWVPARLQINKTWISVNNIWDRIEKVIFLVVDAGLNLYFIYLVRTRLIANGLTKYGRLFRFNLSMIGLSMTMDILLIAMMSLPNDIVYLQFHPLAYLVKLHIEMNMAELITKVVKASNPSGYPDYSGSRSQPTQGKSSSRGQTNNSKHMRSLFPDGHSTTVQAGGDFELPNRNHGGIQKTTTTQVVVKSPPSGYDEQDLASESSSTRELKREHFPHEQP